MSRVLVVDDEALTRTLVADSVRACGHEAVVESSGEDALAAFRRGRFDLVLTDVTMPGMDGIEVCEAIRRTEGFQKTLICFLTARNEDYSQIAGLEAGGDDYVTKPIKPKVILSRISAILRRKEVTTNKPQLISEDLKINREKYLLEKNGVELQLPRKEFELLALLMSKPNMVFTREIILERVWGSDIVVGDRTIDVHIRKLRGKIGDDKITTVKGIGYKFCL